MIMQLLFEMSMLWGLLYCPGSSCYLQEFGELFKRKTGDEIRLDIERAIQWLTKDIEPWNEEQVKKLILSLHFSINTFTLYPKEIKL